MRLGISISTWRGDESPFKGRHYQLVRPLNSPNSVQRPHPPILIGGSGERKTLRMVAQYADACNLFDVQGSQFRDDLARKVGVLREHCALAGAGISYALVAPEGPWDEARLDAVAAILPDVHAIEPERG